MWDALRAGIDVLHHVGSAGTPPYSRELIKALVDSGRPVVPTAAHRVFVWPATLDLPERLQHPQLKKDFPPEIYAEVEFLVWKKDGVPVEASKGKNVSQH